MPVQISVIGAVAAALLTAAIVAFITTPVVRTLAFRVGAVDIPRDSRRMHNHPIPRMGGLAIFFGFILSALIFVPLDAPLRGMLLITLEGGKPQESRSYQAALDEYETAGSMLRSADETTYYQQLGSLIDSLRANGWL